MRSLEQGQGALASRALFFASPRVNVHEKSLKKKKDLTNDSHNLQEVLQQGTEEKNEQILKLSCLLTSFSS